MFAIAYGHGGCYRIVDGDVIVVEDGEDGVGVDGLQVWRCGEGDCESGEEI